MVSRVIYQDSYLFCKQVSSPQPNPKTAMTTINEAMAILFNIRGVKKVVIEGSTYTLYPGELVILNESEAFIFYEDPSEPSEYTLLFFSRYVFRHLDPEFSFLSKFTQRKLGESNVIRFDDRQKRLFSDCMTHMELERDRSALRTSLLGALMLLINEINRCVSYRASDEHPEARKIIDYINGHLAQDLSNDTLSQQFFMSESQFCRNFKKWTGTTLTNYLTRKRVNLARDLLRNNVKMKDVIPMCGFNDYTTFYKHNIKYYKMPPSQNYTRKNHDPLLLNGLYRIE